MKEGIPMVWTMATFIGFTILVAVISYVKTKGDDQSTADGYFLAGRGLPGFVIAGSLLLTNLSDGCAVLLSPDPLCSYTEQKYSPGSDYPPGLPQQG